MISSVYSFVPATIGRTLPSVQSSGNALTQPQAVTTANTSVIAPDASANSSFADKLVSFFSLSPSDFSAIFSEAVVPSGLNMFPQMVSDAYTQSTLLTASRLSLNV